MMFNIDKCKCLHIGHGNSRTTYQLGGTEVPTATRENHLGIIVTENLIKVSEQCAKVTKTANKVLGILSGRMRTSQWQTYCHFIKRRL